MTRDLETLSTEALHGLLKLTTGPLSGHYTGLRAEAHAELERRATPQPAPAPAAESASACNCGHDHAIPPGVLLDIPDPRTPQHVPAGIRYGSQRGNLRAIV